MSVAFGFSADQIIEEGRVTSAEIAEIKSWLFTQKIPRLTDEQIVIFLLSCCNVLEDTRNTIRAYYTVTKSAPEVFDNRRLDRKGLQKFLKVIEGGVVLEPRDDGCVILLVRLQDTNYRNYDVVESMTALTMTFEAAVYDYPPKGLVVILDVAGFGIMHLTRIRLKLLRIFFQYFQEALPVRLAEIHVLNTVYFINKAMDIFRPFINQRVLDMLHFHQADLNMAEFHKKWVPRRCLPEEYGGDLPPMRVLHENTMEKVRQLHPYFEEEELQRHSAY